MSFKKMIVTSFLIPLVFLPAICAAKSPVFKISNGDDYLYIGGTIHVLSANDYPLPQGFDVAFNDSENVFFEVDSGALEAPEIQSKLLRILTFQDSQTLETVLGNETYDSLTAALAERQLPISDFSHYTPAGISLILTVLELQRLGLGDAVNGVDHVFQFKTNQSTAKKASFLETADQQIGFLNKLNDVDPNVMIKSSLDDLSVLSESWKHGLEAWRDGDLNVMGTVMGADIMKTEFPEVYDVLINKRNQHWITQIKPMFDSPEIEFLLVGAMHLVGDDGVIEQLRGLGYTVEQLN